MGRSQILRVFFKGTCIDDINLHHPTSIGPMALAATHNYPFRLPKSDQIETITDPLSKAHRGMLASGSLKWQLEWANSLLLEVAAGTASVQKISYVVPTLSYTLQEVLAKGGGG